VLRAWGRLGLIKLAPYGSRHLYDRTLTHPPPVLPASPVTGPVVARGHRRRRFCPLTFSGYFLLTSRRHRRDLCRQEVTRGGYRESHTVDPRGHPSKRIANRFFRFQAYSAEFIHHSFGHMFQSYLVDSHLLIQLTASE